MITIIAVLISIIVYLLGIKMAKRIKNCQHNYLVYQNTDNWYEDNYKIIYQCQHCGKQTIKYYYYNGIEII